MQDFVRQPYQRPYQGHVSEDPTIPFKTAKSFVKIISQSQSMDLESRFRVL